MEEWRGISGFERHAISSLGRVKSLNYKNTGEEHILYTKKRRYEQVLLKKDGERSFFEVHRLVALAFPEICGEQFPGAEVHHLDGNKLNNAAENLRWVDRSNHRAEHNHTRIRKPKYYA